MVKKEMVIQEKDRVAFKLKGSSIEMRGRVVECNETTVDVMTDKGSFIDLGRGDYEIRFINRPLTPEEQKLADERRLAREVLREAKEDELEEEEGGAE